MLTQRKIFWFWVPLAASWALMMLESPVIQATIARLSEAETMLAASGVVISLSVTIESPVIMLLATSTALTTSPQAYRVLRRFALHLNLILTLIAAIVAFADPIYNWLVPGLMGIPDPIAEAAQPGMKIMTFWSAAIGWRRFRQGILIRFDQTRQVGYGTAIRLFTVVITAAILINWVNWSGVIIGACIWMAGVLSEMVYSHFSSQAIIKDQLSGPDNPDQPPLTYQAVVHYHTPLAATALLALLAQPMIGASLSRMPNPEQNLAAWPIIFSIWLFFRSFGMALPETIVALFNASDTLTQLRRFCSWVAVGSSLGLAITVFSPLVSLYLLYIMAVTPQLTQFIIPGVMAGLLLPALAAIQSWFRGVLMVAKVTGDIYWGMGINLIITGLVLMLGVLNQMPGTPSAAIALSVGTAGEGLYLWWRVKPIQTKSSVIPNPLGG